MLAGPPHPGVAQELRAVPRPVLQRGERRSAAPVQGDDAGGARPRIRAIDAETRLLRTGHDRALAASRLHGRPQTETCALPGTATRASEAAALYGWSTGRTIAADRTR